MSVSDIRGFSKVKEVLSNLFHSFPKVPTGIHDASQSSGIQTNLSRTVNYAPTDCVAVGSAAPFPQDRQLSTTMQPCNRHAINVVVFDAAGVGEGAVVDLIAQRQVAKPSSHTHKSLFDSTRYNVSFDGINYRIFEVVGLEEPNITTGGYLKALEKAHDFVAKLDAAGGVHLLLFVMEVGKVTATTQNNHRLFFEATFQTKVPMVLLFTGLERDAEMEDWWRNKTDIERHGFKSQGCACIATIRGDTPSEDLKYTESQKKIRDLLKDCYLQSPFRPDPNSWLASLAIRLQSFATNGQKPKRRDVVNVPSKCLKLGPGEAQELFTMMEQGDGELDGDAEGGPLGETEAPKKEANAPEHIADKVEAVILSRDLTGQVTNPRNHPFASDSFGDMYEGYVNQGGKVAIKTRRLYVQDFKDLPQKIKQIFEEIAVRSGLDHPNILPLLGIARNPSISPCIPAMVFPWVENGALTTYLEGNKHLMDAQRAMVVNDVAHGLQYLHSQHIIHGNLSGSNVLIQANGRACITGFKLWEPFVGTTFVRAARWAAPELFCFDNSDSEVIPSTWSDVYSFGSIMFQILTGDIPYHNILREEQVILAIGMGRRHKRPEQAIVTDQRWHFMERCWSSLDAASPRPTSDQIVEFTARDLVETMDQGDGRSGNYS